MDADNHKLIIPHGSYSPSTDNQKVDNERNSKKPISPMRRGLKKFIVNEIQKNLNPRLIVAIGEKEFQCNLLLMQHYCTDLVGIWDGDEKIRISPQRILPETFQAVYQWMCLPENAPPHKVPTKFIFDFIKAAEFLGIHELQKQCWKHLGDENNFKEELAFLVYQETVRLGIAHTRQMLLSRISKFFLPLVASADFLQLSGYDVVELLSSNFIAVHTEMEVFMTAIRWLKHNWMENKLWTRKLLKCVRFSLISENSLGCLSKEFKSSDDEVFSVIVDIPEVKKAVNEAGVDRAHNKPSERQWIIPYGRKDILEDDYITYESFLQFLSMLRSKGPEFWKGFITKQKCGKDASLQNEKQMSSS